MSLKMNLPINVVADRSADLSTMVWASGIHIANVVAYALIGSICLALYVCIRQIGFTGALSILLKNLSRCNLRLYTDDGSDFNEVNMRGLMHIYRRVTNLLFLIGAVCYTNAIYYILVALYIYFPNLRSAEHATIVVVFGYTHTLVTLVTGVSIASWLVRSPQGFITDLTRRDHKAPVNDQRTLLEDNTPPHEDKA